MTEKQREEELFKRAERREELKKRFEISQKLKLQQKKKERSDEQSMNSDSDAGDNFSGHQANSDYQGRRKGYEEKHAKKSCHSHVCVGVCGSKVLGGVRYRELNRRWGRNLSCNGKNCNIVIPADITIDRYHYPT